MSESVAESSVPAPFDAPAQQYSLSSDLARMCLPSEFKDSYRRLAWVDSICFLFLIVGLIGLKQTNIQVKPVSEITEQAPVVFTPPEEQPKPEPEVKQDEPPPDTSPMETPQVVTVVAAVDSPAIAFAVPVQGAVAVASPRFATPPPPANYVPPKPTKFNPDASAGTFPKPEYPGYAIRNRYQGTVEIEIKVDGAGAVVDAKVVKTSGYTLLDEAAIKAVKEKWKFPPGAARDYIWPCVFELK